MSILDSQEDFNEWADTVTKLMNDLIFVSKDGTPTRVGDMPVEEQELLSYLLSHGTALKRSARLNHKED